MRTEETVLAVEGFALENTTIIANILIILVEHIAWAHSIDALLTHFNR